MDEHTRTQQSARPDTMDDDDKRSVRLVWTSPKRGQKGAVTLTSRLTHLRSVGPRGRRKPKAMPTIDPLHEHGEPRRPAHTGRHQKKNRRRRAPDGPKRGTARATMPTVCGTHHEGRRPPSGRLPERPKNHSVKQSNPRTCITHVQGLGRRRVMRGGTGRWPPSQGKKPPPGATHTRTTCQPEPAKRKRRRRRRGATRQYGHP